MIGRPPVHGMRGSVEYMSWIRMKSRCYDTANPDYQHYGGRGIQVCPRYKNSFPAFYYDVGPRPTRQHSIDRIENNGHYSCGTCSDCLQRGWLPNIRWATMIEQHRNYRQNVYMTYNGLTLCATEWAERLNGFIPYATLLARKHTGWSDERALTTPVRKQRKPIHQNRTPR